MYPQTAANCGLHASSNLDKLQYFPQCTYIESMAELSKNQAQERIHELTKELNYHNQLYYMEDRTEISDQEFDRKMHELEDLEKQFPDLKRADSPTHRVGGTVIKEFPTVYHKYPMLSLGNTYSADELGEFDRRIRKALGDDFDYVCELKFDGVAISLHYEEGLLQQAVTRGDGERGDEITTNAKTIYTLPLRVEHKDLPQQFEVRGEVILPWKAFNQLNKEREKEGKEPFANPRNTASGTLKMQDSSIVASRGLDIYVYQILGEGLDIQDHYASLQLLKEAGFRVSDAVRKCKDLNEVFDYLRHWDQEREKLEVDIDGVVVKVNNFEQRQELGTTAKSPRWAMAYKYQAETAETRLHEVQFQVGRTGQVTPVAQLEPVLLDGTRIKRASIHNADEIERLDLHYKDMVRIEKGGEIIPKITSVNKDARKPSAKNVAFVEKCPACGTELKREPGEAAHYCPNHFGCPPQITGKIEHFIQRSAMNIEQLGSETIELFYKKELIKSPADLYELKYEDIIGLERFGDKSVNNILESIEGSKKRPFDRVLFALGIRMVGSTVAEKLVQAFPSMEQLQQASKEEMEEVRDIGSRIAQSVRDFFEEERNREEIERLGKAGLHMAINREAIEEQQSGKFSGKTLVVSGVFSDFSRDGIKQAIKQNGGKVVSSVSGNTDYLIAGENMGPKKRKKAEDLGIEILDEAQFKKMLDG